MTSRILPRPYRRHRRTRTAMGLAPAGGIAIAGWVALHEAGGAIGLLGDLAGMTVFWPLFAGLFVAGLPGLLPGLVPCRLRMAWRAAHVRPSIPRWLRRAVYAADRYRCVYCGSRASLQLDHVHPWSLGGLTTLLNLVTLCGVCNRVKSNHWVARDGYVFYRPWEGAGNEALAARILRRERAVRCSPLRWALAAFALL